jgi:TfoX/Sxy family transcriptional regulator of competence genes
MSWLQAPTLLKHLAAAPDRAAPAGDTRSMAYDRALAARIRDELSTEPGVTEKAMFGGLGFMVDGHLAVAASSSGDLMVRADSTESESWVDGETVRPMEMRGRPMTGWLLVSVTAVSDDDALARWVARGVDHVRSLPPAQPRRRTRSAPG